MGVYFHRGPAFGEHGWAFLSWAFLLEKFLLGPLEICRMACRRVPLSKAAQLVNLERVCFLGFFREKKYPRSSFTHESLGF